MKAFSLINQQALISAADALRRDDHDLIEALGLNDMSASVAHKLKNLTLVEIACAHEFRAPILRIEFDLKATEWFLNFAANKSQEDELINRAIAAGMRHGQLYELKGVARRDFDQRRQRLGLTELSKGPVQSLNEDDELTVLREWKRLQSIADLLTRYVELHERTGVGLDRAWICIKSSET
jgi:hypothetical protein